MSDLEAEIMSFQSSHLVIRKDQLAKLGGVESLSRILGLNSYIKELSLWGGDNGIGDDGALAIAEMLKLNSTLQVIGLEGNRIEDDGALAIAEALEFNSTLQEIDLEGNEIGWENHQLIEQALEGCRNRRKQNARLWVCSFIDHWRAEQRLNFDNLMFAFYFYPLLERKYSKY
jgi:hypothetical protein